MKYSRWLILVMLVILVAGLLAAQETSVTYCGQLSDTDCEILQNSAVAMRDVNANAFQLQMDLTVNNIPDAPFESLALSLSGNGSFAADMSSLSELEIQPTELDMMSFYPLISDWLRTVKTDITLTLNLSQELIDSAANEGTTLPSNLTMNLRMVDGVAYVDLSELSALDTQLGIPSGWVGIDIAEFYGSILPQMSGDMALNFDISPLVTALMEPENLVKFVTIERLADSEVMGQTMAVFETQLDYVAMLDLPAFNDMLTSMMPEGQDVDEMLSVIRAMYSGMTITITEEIGLEDSLIHSTTFHMTMDMTSFMQMVGEMTAAPVIDINFVITSEEFNTDFAVTAPEAAMILPLDQMMLPPESGE